MNRTPANGSHRDVFNRLVSELASALGVSSEHLVEQFDTKISEDRVPSDECLQPHESQNLSDLSDARQAHVEECSFCRVLVASSLPPKAKLKEFLVRATHEQVVSTPVATVQAPRVFERSRARWKSIDFWRVSASAVMAVVILFAVFQGGRTLKAVDQSHKPSFVALAPNPEYYRAELDSLASVSVLELLPESYARQRELLRLFYCATQNRTVSIRPTDKGSSLPSPSVDEYLEELERIQAAADKGTLTSKEMRRRIELLLLLGHLREALDEYYEVPESPAYNEVRSAYLVLND